MATVVVQRRPLENARLLFGVALGRGLGDVAQSLFTLAERRRRDAIDQQRMDQQNQQLMLPILQFQRMMSRDEVRDKQWLAEQQRQERNTAKANEFRSIELDQANRRIDQATAAANASAARAEAALNETRNYHQFLIDRGTPEAVADRAVTTAMARYRAEEAAKQESPVSLEEAKQYAVPFGTKRKELIGKTAIDPKERSAYGATLAILDQAEQAYRNLYTDQGLVNPLQPFRVVKEQLKGNPDAVFLSQLPGYLSRVARASGESGALATKDIERAASVVSVPAWKSGAAAIAAIQNARDVILAGAASLGLKPEDVRPPKREESGPMSPAVALPSAATPMTAPASESSPVLKGVDALKFLGGTP